MRQYSLGRRKQLLLPCMSLVELLTNAEDKVCSYVPMRCPAELLGLTSDAKGSQRQSLAAACRARSIACAAALAVTAAALLLVGPATLLPAAAAAAAILLAADLMAPETAGAAAGAGGWGCYWRGQQRK
jgi:hypothetical protein